MAVDSDQGCLYITVYPRGKYTTQWEQVQYDKSHQMETLSALLPRYGAFDLGLAVSVPLPIVTGIFVLLWFQSCLT